MPKILPCPFCGGDQQTLDPELDLVFCNTCHAESGLDGLKGWNRRDITAALYVVLGHLGDSGVPSGAGKVFEARLAKAAEPEPSDPDGHFKRDMAEAVVTLIKCLRQQTAEAAEKDGVAQ